VRFDQVPSWRIAEDEGWDLTAALFIRDVAGLRDRDHAADPPALSPAVQTDRELRDSIDPSTAGRAWRSWWSTLLRDRAAVTPGDDPRVRLRWAASGTAFGGWSEEVWRSAFAWADQRKRDQIEQVVARADRARNDRLAVGRIVAAVVETLGRPARPFDLTITTLPVAGTWTHRPDEHQVLVSEALRADPATLGDVLRPVLRELA
jgi:hypothetical protein